MSNISNTYHIHAGVGSGSQPGAELAAILESLLPVKFGSFDDGRAGVAGKIMVDGAFQRNGSDQAGDVSSFSVPRAGKTFDTEELIEATVEFVDDPDTPFPFRGRTVKTKVARRGSNH